MPAYLPFLVRRFDTFYFRIGVPAALRAHVGRRELVRTLSTQQRDVAIPAALAMAAAAKALFLWIAQMTDSTDDDISTPKLDPDKLPRVVQSAIHGLEIKEIKAQHQTELDAERGEHRRREAALRNRHEQELRVVEQRARADALQRVLAGGGSQERAIASSAQRSPLLQAIVDDFLAKYRTTKAAMPKKHRTVLPLLVEVIGNRPVAEIRQQHVNEFFDVVHGLPPRWGDLRKRTGASAREIAAGNTMIGVNEKTFDDTYKASIRVFLKWARLHYGDQGFPTALTTEGVEYRGDRKEGERRQRAFTEDELKRLFEGPELARLAANADTVHCFWLLALALYSGARVNELCQVNPQCDVGEIDGIYYIDVTGATEPDERITKRVKNSGSARRIPVHSKLVELGFVAYVQFVAQAEAKLLFPAWKPSRGKASSAAERYGF